MIGVLSIVRLCLTPAKGGYPRVVVRCSRNCDWNTPQVIHLSQRLEVSGVSVPIATWRTEFTSLTTGVRATQSVNISTRMGHTVSSGSQLKVQGVLCKRSVAMVCLSISSQ